MSKSARRFYLALLGASALFAVSFAHAQYVGPSNTPPTTVEEILADPIDDQNVQLKGHLLRQVSAQNYIFSDGTAEIMTKIKEKQFKGLPEIDEHTEIEIHGEVDTGRYRAPKIEVDKIRVLQ